MFQFDKKKWLAVGLLGELLDQPGKCFLLAFIQYSDKEPRKGWESGKDEFYISWLNLSFVDYVTGQSCICSFVTDIPAWISTLLFSIIILTEPLQETDYIKSPKPNKRLLLMWKSPSSVDKNCPLLNTLPFYEGCF